MTDYYKYIAALSYGLLTVILANGVEDSGITRKLILMADTEAPNDEQHRRAREIAALIARAPREGDPAPERGGKKPPQS